MSDVVKSVNSRVKYTGFHFYLRYRMIGACIHVLFSFLVLIFSIYAEFQIVFKYTYARSLCDRSHFMAVELSKNVFIELNEFYLDIIFM